MSLSGESDPRSPGDVRSLGAVFCGGRSRRMGVDKALLDVGGRPLIERAVETLAALAPEVVLATGDRPRYAGLGLRCVLDRRSDGGPLAGLEAVLEEAGDAEWVLALACDMPRARPEVFRALLSRAARSGADACLLGTREGLEPLYAVYAPRCLRAVRRALDAGARRMVAFHGDADVLVLDEEELPGELASAGCARNVNTPEELAREREVCA